MQKEFNKEFKMKKIISGFVLMLLVLSCKNQEEQLKDVGFWKYSEGFHIGDLMDPKDDLLEIKDDTIFSNDFPVARFLEIENRFFSGDKVLYIQSLTSDEAGVYVSK